MRNLVREIGQSAFVSSGQDTIQIPRDYAQVDILVELYAKIVKTHGTTAGTACDVAPAQLLRHIEIRANGRDVIKSLDFEGLVRLTHLRYGTAPNNTVLTAETQTETQSCYIYGMIPFAMWRAVKPYDTLFNAKPLTTFEAVLTYGVIGDCFDATTYDSTYTVSEGVIYLSGKEAVGLDPRAILPINKESTQEVTISATTTELKLSLNYAKDLQYRSIVLRSTIGKAVSNAVVNNVQLKSGGVIFYNLNSRRNRARMKTMYGLETMPTGYYSIDFAEDGRIGDSLDTSGLSSLDLVLDVTASAGVDKVKVYTTEIIVPTVVK